MPILYSYSKARRKFAKVLEQAVVEGEVLVQRRDGQVFVIRPVLEKSSPLDVPSVNLGMTTSELVEIIRERREELG